MPRLNSGLSSTNIQQQFQMLISCGALPTGALRIDGIEYQIRKSSDGISISISSDERRKRVGFISSLLPVQRSEIAFIEQIRQGFQQAVEAATRGERIPVDELSLPGLLSSGANFSGAVIRGVQLNGLDLRGVNLSGARFEGCAFNDVNLDRADLSGCAFSHCNFHNVQVAEADVRKSGFWHCRITGRTHFGESNLFASAFGDCVFDNVVFQGSKLPRAVFVDCFMNQISFYEADISHAHFQRINTDIPEGYERIVHSSYFGRGYRLNFYDANVEGAVFEDCDLGGAMLGILRGCSVTLIRTNIDGSLRYNVMNTWNMDQATRDSLCGPALFPCLGKEQAKFASVGDISSQRSDDLPWRDARVSQPFSWLVSGQGCSRPENTIRVSIGLVEFDQRLVDEAPACLSLREQIAELELKIASLAERSHTVPSDDSIPPQDEKTEDMRDAQLGECQMQIERFRLELATTSEGLRAEARKLMVLLHEFTMLGGWTDIKKDLFVAARDHLWLMVKGLAMSLNECPADTYRGTDEQKRRRAAILSGFGNVFEISDTRLLQDDTEVHRLGWQQLEKMKRMTLVPHFRQVIFDKVLEQDPWNRFDPVLPGIVGVREIFRNSRLAL